VERIYALTRVTAGDYIVPSNDGRTLWRVYRYYEDGSASYGDDTPLRGWFWSVASYAELFPVERLPLDFLEWEHWETHETLLASRKDALDAVPWGTVSA